MNAHAPSSSPLTEAAINNADVLRALGRGVLLTTPAEVARAAGLATKNIARTLERLTADGLIVQTPVIPGASHAGFALTDAGQLALRAIDLAAGAPNAQSAATGDHQDPTLLMVPHHHLRPNPLNPRKTFDPAEIDALAGTIVEAGDILQNLIVYPADAEGIHTLAAGERRWRAVGRLIENGNWPAERPLPARVREPTQGQVSFIALVENGQRQDLSLIEQARAYQALVAETGWSARAAAMKTGRDPRSVQEMLKILEEASPQSIARHETAPADFTWQDLRESVRQRSLPLDDPDQLDLEPAPVAAPVRDDPLVVNGVRFPNITLANQARIRAQGGAPSNSGGSAKAKGDRPLNARERLALLELAAKMSQSAVRPPGAGQPYFTTVRKYWLDQAASELTSRKLIAFNHHLPNGPHAAFTEDGEAWLRARNVVPTTPQHQLAIEEARLEAGCPAREIGQSWLEPYDTPWLNVAGDKPQDPPAAEIESEPAIEAALEPPIAEDEDPDAVEAQAILDQATAGVATGLFGNDGQMKFRDLLEAAGLNGPFAAGVGDSSGAVWAKQDEEACTVDVNRDLPDALAQARAELIAFALNAACGHSHKSWS